MVGLPVAVSFTRARKDSGSASSPEPTDGGTYTLTMTRPAAATVSAAAAYAAASLRSSRRTSRAPGTRSNRPRENARLAHSQLESA